MEIHTCIDWLSFTSHSAGTGRYPVLPPSETGADTREARPLFGYRKALTTTHGVYVMYEGSAASMGTHYQYSGQCLAGLFDASLGYARVLDWHKARHDKCTRLDLAIDVKDNPAFMTSCHDALMENRYQGTARKITVVKNASGPGETIYCGSRQSELFVRIYDKAAETGTEGPWTRIEVECKGDRARGVLAALNSGAVTSIGALAQSVIQHVVKLDTPDWQIVFGEKIIPLAPPQPKDHDTEKWVLTQVAPALAKFEARYPERRLLEALIESVEDMLHIDSSIDIL